jgi:hypothetical protein
MFCFLTFAEVHEWMAISNLIILVFVVSFLMGLSMLLQRKKKFVWHGNTMMIVVMIAALLTVVHMGYSFIFVATETLESFNWVAFLGVIHGVVGLTTLSLGIWLIGVWALGESSELQFCAPRKRLMWRILALWITTLSLGLLYYPLHFILG